MNRRGTAAYVGLVYAIAVLLSLGLIVLGAVRGGDSVLLATGVLGLIIVFSLGPIAARQEERRRAMDPGVSGDTGARLAKLTAALERLAEQQALSDDARRVFNRRGERELLRRAIEEDMAAEDWDAALVLVRELAERFGYRADAEEFRDRIENARYETVERKVSAAVASLDGMISSRRWEEARSEAARITRLYPDSPRVEGLRHRVEQARTQYKQDLERRFLHAAGEDRIDEAMTLLRELDQYLTESEAEPFKEVARGVIGRARENLGVQFKLAVQDKRWREAADVGEKILNEFPNTRMAAEIRQVIDGIRERVATLT